MVDHDALDVLVRLATSLADLERADKKTGQCRQATHGCEDGKGNLADATNLGRATGRVDQLDRVELGP